MAVILIAGCATGQGGLAASVPEERLARRQAECAASIVPSDRSEALQAALEQGGLASTSLYLMLRGAAEGAVVGAVTGRGAGDGAWIGAAVGAGVGVIVGLAVGIGKSVAVSRGGRGLRGRAAWLGGGWCPRFDALTGNRGDA